MLVAHHINAMQYVALQMMYKHFGWKVGKFFYFINNLHIYDNQFEQAEELLRQEPSDCGHTWFWMYQMEPISLTSNQKILI